VAAQQLAIVLGTEILGPEDMEGWSEPVPEHLLRRATSRVLVVPSSRGGVAVNVLIVDHRSRPFG
jgi:hypothetical protein